MLPKGISSGRYVRDHPIIKQIINFQPPCAAGYHFILLHFQSVTVCFSENRIIHGVQKLSSCSTYILYNVGLVSKNLILLICMYCSFSNWDYTVYWISSFPFTFPSREGGSVTISLEHFSHYSGMFICR